MAAIYLFNGANYKRGIDDGRLRVPLTLPEIDAIVYDPEVPNDTDNSIGTEINLNQYSDILCDLAAGDQIFIGLVPDATLIRGIWSLTFQGVEGFAGDIDLVKCTDVLDDIEADGDGSAAAMYLGTHAIPLDKTLGNPPCGMGVVAAELPWIAGDDGYESTEVRDPEAFAATVIEPTYLLLREACYIRLTVTAIPEEADTDSDCCLSCTEVTYPHFQVGITYDRTCADKLRNRRWCNCGTTGLCNEGC